MNTNPSSKVSLETEADLLFTDLTPEEASAINGGFFKNLFRGAKRAVKAIGNGVSDFILDEIMTIYKNPWGWATGRQQRDVTELDTWTRK